MRKKEWRLTTYKSPSRPWTRRAPSAIEDGKETELSIFKKKIKEKDWMCRKSKLFLKVIRINNCTYTDCWIQGQNPKFTCIFMHEQHTAGKWVKNKWCLQQHETTVCCLAAKSRLTLVDPMDCSPPGSSVDGILQAGTLEWFPISFSRESS